MTKKEQFKQYHKWSLNADLYEEVCCQIVKIKRDWCEPSHILSNKGVATMLSYALKSQFADKKIDLEKAKVINEFKKTINFFNDPNYVAKRLDSNSIDETDKGYQMINNLQKTARKLYKEYEQKAVNWSLEFEKKYGEDAFYDNEASQARTESNKEYYVSTNEELEM